MGKCKYCGIPAGMLSSVHKECDAKHINGINEIKNLLENIYDYDRYRVKLKEVSNNSFISNEELEKLLSTKISNVIIDYAKHWTGEVMLGLDGELLHIENEFSLPLINNVVSKEGSFFLKDDGSKIEDNPYLKDLLKQFPDLLK